MTRLQRVYLGSCLLSLHIHRPVCGVKAERTLRNLEHIHGFWIFIISFLRRYDSEKTISESETYEN